MTHRMSRRGSSSRSFHETTMELPLEALSGTCRTTFCLRRKRYRQTILFKQPAQAILAVKKSYSRVCKYDGRHSETDVLGHMHHLDIYPGTSRTCSVLCARPHCDAATSDHIVMCVHFNVRQTKISSGPLRHDFAGCGRLLLVPEVFGCR